MSRPLSPRPRHLLALPLLAAFVLWGAAAVHAAPGDRDPSFGSGGIVHTQFPGTYSENPFSVLRQPDGKLVVVGEDASGGAFVAVARYLPDGTLDPDFGTGGLVAPSAPFIQIGYTGALQADGKIVVLAYAGRLIRFEAGGAVDTSYGDGGIAHVFGSGSTPVSRNLALQPDGKLLVLTNREPGYPRPPELQVDRLDDAGSVELTIRGTTQGNGMVLQPDGKIVVAGTRLTRYLPDGTLDPDFGVGGEVADVFARAVTLDPDGKLTTLCGSGFSGCFARYDAAGNPDPTFGDGGRVELDLDALPVDTSSLSLFQIVTQADGKYVAIGRGGYSIVLRLTHDGHLDPTFGTGGIVSVPDVANGFFDVLVEPDGNVVAVGGYGDFSVLRLVGSVCGDGVQQEGEACDDGDRDDGDGCDGNCTPTACGNGIVTAGEACDDGNLVAGDCCSPACTLESVGSSCDDGDACTLGDTCDAGKCRAGAPRDCDDGNGCTADDCDPFAGLCRHEPSTDATCPDPEPRLAWLRKAWARGSAVGDEEPHFGSQTLLIAGKLFVYAHGEYFGGNVQVLDPATGEVLHIIRSTQPESGEEDLGPIAALGDDLLVTRRTVIDHPEYQEFSSSVDVYDGTTYEIRQRLFDPTPDGTWGWFGASTVLAVDGKVLVFDARDHVVYVFDPASGALLHALQAPPPEDPAWFGSPLVAFGSRVLVGGSGTVHLFDVATGALVRTFVDPTPGVGTFGDVVTVFDGQVLIGGRREDTVYLFDAGTGAILRTFDDPDGVDRTFGTGVAVLGTDVVVSRKGGRVHVFDGTTGALRYTLLDPSPSSDGCFGRLLQVLGDKLAVSDPCANYGPFVHEDESGVVYVFAPATGELLAVIPDARRGYRNQIHAVLAWDRTILVHSYGEGNGGLTAYTSCIDGAVAAGEACDDGNFTSGDGCDVNCTVTGCGNGLATGDEDCDDGNQVDDDACTNQCVANVCGDGILRRSWEQCDDGAANGTATSCCTSDCRRRNDGETCEVPSVCGNEGVCSAGTCAATAAPCQPCGVCDPELGCVAAPATGCRESLAPHDTSLTIERHAKPERARFAWRWRKGAATLASTFGVPQSRDGYALCLYDESGTSPRILMSASVAPGRLCRAFEPCWKTHAHGALLRYRDPKAAADGIASIDLTPGDDGDAAVTVIGRGRQLHVPELPLETPVRAQLRAGNGQCWESTYSGGEVGRNDSTRFRARGD